jgi:hypothetical protein
MVLPIFGCTILGVFAFAHFDGTHDRCHVMLSSAIASVAATDQAFVNLDLMRAANAVALWPDHSGPQLMK